MFVLKQVGNTPNIPYQRFVCDTTADLTDIKDADFAAECYVIETQETYIRNSAGQWKLKPTSTGGSGGGGGSTGGDIEYDGGAEV